MHFLSFSDLDLASYQLNESIEIMCQLRMNSEPVKETRYVISVVLGVRNPIIL